MLVPFILLVEVTVLYLSISSAERMDIPPFRTDFTSSDDFIVVELAPLFLR